MDDTPGGGGLRPGKVTPGPGHSPDPGRPLPDLTAIHLAELPDSWPPYDDEVSATWPAGPGGHSAAAEPHRVEMLAVGPQAAGTQAAGTQAAGTQAAESGEGAEDGDGGAGPGRWPNQFAQVLAETLSGARPASQITPWTTERARAHIRRLGPLLAAGQRPRVQRVLTSRPVEGVVEVAVIVGFGPRTRALAARLERAGPQPATLRRPARQARWLCTAVESA